jgi:DtxR family manganese transport transcriptional regulator
MKETRAAEAGSAGRFARVRRDHARETAEDYAELVLDLGGGGRPVRPADLARRLGVSHVTVLRALERLARAGVLRRDARRGVSLSAAGRRIARAARARYELLVAFLEHIGAPRAIAETDAEGIEHHISRNTLRVMKAFVARARLRARGRATDK